MRDRNEVSHVDEVDQMGGETSCFLPSLDTFGNVPDPRTIIRAAQPHEIQAGNALRVALDPDGLQEQTYDEICSELAPRADESVHDYRERLEGPVCRTAAWRLVLRAQDQNVAVVTRANDRSMGHVHVLLTYLRGLME